MVVAFDSSGAGFDSSNNSITVNLAAAANDTLIILCAFTDSNSTVSSLTVKPAGYTQMYHVNSNGYVWWGYRFYVGNPPNSSFSQNATWGKSYIWVSYTGVIAVDFAAANSLDPPNLTAGAGIPEVWLAGAAVGDWSGANGKHSNLTPSGYTARRALANSDVVGGLYDKVGVAQTENPGLALSGSPIAPQGSITMALNPTDPDPNFGAPYGWGAVRMG